MSTWKRVRVLKGKKRKKKSKCKNYKSYSLHATSNRHCKLLELSIRLDIHQWKFRHIIVGTKHSPNESYVSQWQVWGGHTGTGVMLTLVGNGNLEGSVLQGVWMAVSGGGHNPVISWKKGGKKRVKQNSQTEKNANHQWSVNDVKCSFVERCIHTFRISSTEFGSPAPWRQKQTSSALKQHYEAGESFNGHFLKKTCRFRPPYITCCEVIYSSHYIIRSLCSKH